MAHKFNPINKNKLDNEWRRENLPPVETLEKLGLQAADVFADIGCGIGYFTIPAAKMIGDNSAYALDTSPEMLAEVVQRSEAAGLNNIKTVKTEELDLLIPDEAVSFALLVNVIHEIVDKNQFLEETSRILKPGGKLAIVDWEKAQTEMGPPIDHRIAKDDVIAILEEIGFYCQKTQAFTENFYGLVMVKNS
ncbi:class I SAM-dependent methyltransferase [Acetobacterium wieringae]|uniref:Demethylrebeccamycin-D-glucose O-methyltransferase n=1 Tax=Acetobacterium wieringae TaxID=52694 RepID=A0A1F2PJL3_9FIRM|nr:class I SAM-dependent methyltransferase [Acetobacterium wieringae]OFV71042.1 demethylrebeccamycin-D-glucose O-methyltransferase [Acetobacterium wieringae]